MKLFDAFAVFTSFDYLPQERRIYRAEGWATIVGLVGSELLDVEDVPSFDYHSPKIRWGFANVKVPLWKDEGDM